MIFILSVPHQATHKVRLKYQQQYYHGQGRHRNEAKINVRASQMKDFCVALRSTCIDECKLPDHALFLNNVGNGVGSQNLPAYTISHLEKSKHIIELEHHL